MTVALCGSLGPYSSPAALLQTQDTLQQAVHAPCCCQAHHLMLGVHSAAADDSGGVNVRTQPAVALWLYGSLDHLAVQMQLDAKFKLPSNRLCMLHLAFGLITSCWACVQQQLMNPVALRCLHSLLLMSGCL